MTTETIKCKTKISYEKGMIIKDNENDKLFKVLSCKRIWTEKVGLSDDYALEIEAVEVKQ